MGPHLTVVTFLFQHLHYPLSLTLSFSSFLLVMKPKLAEIK